MILNNFFANRFENLADLVSRVDDSQLCSLAELIRNTSLRKGKIILVGNGGSASIASHASVDLTKAAGIRAVCFNDSALLTCFGNDFGYERWVSKAIQYYSDPADLVVLISSSGSSPNIVNAASICSELGLRCVTFSGFSHSNPLREAGILNFWVDSTDYNHVENTHQIWLLSVIDYLKFNFDGEKSK